jgi:hypothetical protein
MMAGDAWRDDPDDASREDATSRLARSREELRALLEPHRRPLFGNRRSPGVPGEFPRSRTMRFLTSGGGVGTAAALGCGLLISRPVIALRILKMIPFGAVIRMLLLRLTIAPGAKT